MKEKKVVMVDNQNTSLTIYKFCLSLEAVLPKIMKKILSDPQRRVSILAQDHSDIAYLDSLLWKNTRNFIPHGTKYDEYKEVHPIYITDDLQDIPSNNNDILLTVNNLLPYTQICSYSRYLSLIAMERFSSASGLLNNLGSYKDNGCRVDVWQQDHKGGWQNSSTTVSS